MNYKNDIRLVRVLPEFLGSNRRAKGASVEKKKPKKIWEIGWGKAFVAAALIGIVLAWALLPTLLIVRWLW